MTEPEPVQAAPWAFLDTLLARTLDVRPGEGGATFFTDHNDPNVATVGLGIHDFANRSGGNSFDRNTGLYRRTASGWTHVMPLQIFGIQPRDPVFAPGRIEITTTTLGPNEPRCCPTQITTWTIDTNTGQVTRRP
ncbi:MAG: hypothetical protein AAGB28_18985 [Pseudomonadota bacterium]